VHVIATIMMLIAILIIVSSSIAGFRRQAKHG
jgi:hypothetical protein